MITERAGLTKLLFVLKEIITDTESARAELITAKTDQAFLSRMN